MLYKIFKTSFFLLFIVFYSVSFAANDFSLELHEANLSEAIRIIAKFLKINVVISPNIHGNTTFNLHHVSPATAFDLLLMSQGLGQWQVNNIIYIGTQEELIKHQQEMLKWQVIREDTLSLVDRVWHIRYANAEEVARLIQNPQTSLLSKQGQLRVDVRTNVIYIRDNDEKIKLLGRFIRQLDVPIQQILIEARLATVDNDFIRELGIRFAVNSAKETNGLNANFGRLSGYSLAVAKLADNSLLDVKLTALENAGHAEIISNPTLFTANQQAASIEAGEEVPYQEVSESGGTAVVFKKAVLGLKVKPQILPGEKILLQLQINQDRPSHRIVLGMPTISTRQIITNVLVKAGQTIVLGGIYESASERSQEGLPYIRQIPLLGWLTSQQNFRENKRELLIFVTPKIVNEDR